MKCRVAFLMFAWAMFSACSDDHPLTGGWHEHTATGEHGLQLEFDAESNRLAVHGRPRPDGGHDHMQGTYTLDGQRLQVEWVEAGQTVKLQGTLQGDAIELSGPGNQKLDLHRGGGGHGH